MHPLDVLWPHPAAANLASGFRADQRLEDTVMPTGLLVVTAPALSVARAVRTWLPGGTFFHVNEYGTLVSWPSTVVPSRNSTFVTLPSGSLAVALTVIVGFHANVAPFAGDVMLAVGGMFPELTVIVDFALVVTPPRSSVARAVSV